jgi:class 3 adenylate cyclase
VRKIVTVVFADVTGSTALGERLDPESLRRVMARYFETASACLARHGGTVEKFIGDAAVLRLAGRAEESAAAAREALRRFEQKGNLAFAAAVRRSMAEPQQRA